MVIGQTVQPGKHGQTDRQTRGGIHATKCIISLLHQTYAVNSSHYGVDHHITIYGTVYFAFNGLLTLSK